MGRKNYAGIKSFAEKIVKQEASLGKTCSYKEAERRVKQMLKIFKEELTDTDNAGVQFVDLFTLEKVLRAKRRGRNPITCKDIIVPEHNSLKVKVGDELHALLNP